MTSTTSTRTIEVLRSLFASYGLPEEIVSDNGPQFVSAEFEQFMTRNGVRHTRVPPYHPASNGAAERSVQILKRTLLKQVLDGDSQLSIRHRLASFLLKYRATPHTVTGVSPAELFLKRQLRTRLSLLKPDVGRRVVAKQNEQKKHHDKGRTAVRTFTPQQKVYVRNFRGGKEKWIPGTIVKPLGPLTYLVRVGEKIRYVHVDHLLATLVEQDVTAQCQQFEQLSQNQSVDPAETQVPLPTSSMVDMEDGSSDQPEPPSVAPDRPASPTSKGIPSPVTGKTDIPPRRYPVRERKAPQRLDL